MHIFPGYARLPRVVLASRSPRRAQLLREMGLSFTAEPADVQEEALSIGVDPYRLPLLLAQAKAQTLCKRLSPEGQSLLVIAADTVVIQGGELLDKPRNAHEAREHLLRLSGGTHHVKSGVALVCGQYHAEIEAVSEVTFKQLVPSEISYYIENFSPYDKAGGYGIQEWIGLTCIEAVKGSYTNVMGLPTQALHKELLAFASVSA